MKRYSKGRRHEWRLRDMLRREGYVVYRSAGSKGAADLIALKDSQAYLIQVKVNKRPTLTEIERLRDEAAQCGAFPVIAVWWERKRQWSIKILTD